MRGSLRQAEDISQPGRHGDRSDGFLRGHRLLPGSLQGTLLFLLLVMLVPLIGVQVFQYYSSLQTQLSRESQGNLEVARAVAAAFGAYMYDIHHQNMAVGLAVVSLQPMPPEEANRYLRDIAGQYPPIESYSWANPQGQVIASSLAAVIGRDVSDRPYFREIVEGREWSVSDLSLESSAGEPTFGIVRGVRNAAGILQGILVASANPNRLSEVLTIQRFGEAAVVIVDRDGTLVYRYPGVELTWEQRKTIESDPAIADALAGVEVTSTSTSPADNQRRIAAYVPIRSIGWVAGANQPEADVLVPLTQDLVRNLVCYIIVADVAFILAIVVSRNVTIPMRRLQEQALAIAHGQFGRRAEVGGPVELQRLGESFNAMADEVQRAFQLREDFLTVATHELTTPLAVIKGYSQLLIKNEPDETKRKIPQVINR